MKALHIVRALAAVAALSALSTGASAQALLSNANVDVKVTLTSRCQWSGTPPTGLAVDFGGYTAFQAAAKPGSTTNLVLECTRSFGLSPTVAWNAAAGVAAADGKGVVAGLYYELTLTGAQTSAGTAPTATATPGGTPRVVTFALGGTMPGGQAGTDAAGAEVTQTRTLTLTF